jgi:radical SAM superfamily enzyme YgiQ (UPF0313 family)
MINRYTADRKIRSDDAYTPGGAPGKRPDRATLVYTQRCQEAFKDVPVLIGGIEASLRRIAHYDYWQDKVRRSHPGDSKADLLLYGNAERAIVEIAHRLARASPSRHHRHARHRLPGAPWRPEPQGWFEMDSTEVDLPGRIDDHINPYQTTSEAAASGRRLCEDCARRRRTATAGRPAAPQWSAWCRAPAQRQGKVQLPPRDAP